MSRTQPAASAALHRSAFGIVEDGPSSGSFAAMGADPRYRGVLDVATVLTDRTLAGTCHAWLDDASGVVALEPVATDPRHRRLGHARAAIHAALSAARDAGATRARVCARADEDLSAATFYAGVGFRPRARTVHLVR
ncbi:GNAT family N-acetyltransferase [Aeromicrobium halocynthiae]|uniref:GNAT family N-acetyltransferase n=1 Tax=Aeromicrobium halocynthiae TaxID=560557 RepID=UPI0031D00E3B